MRLDDDQIEDGGETSTPKNEYVGVTLPGKLGIRFRKVVGSCIADGSARSKSDVLRNAIAEFVNRDEFKVLFEN